MNFQKMLKGKKVIITGGSSGIGRAAAGIFASNGAGVTLVARRKEILKKAAEDISAQIVSGGQYVDYFSVDVSQEKKVRDFARAYYNSRGAPDIIINSAGIAHPAQYFEDMSPGTFRDVMDVNFHGVLNMCAAFVPMMKQRGGDIVNVSSSGGIVACFGFSAYCASKFAVAGFTNCLRSEMKRFNINVTLFCPSNVHTPMFDMLEEYRQKENKALSDQFAPMDPAEVAHVMIEGMLKKKAVVYTRNSTAALLLYRLTPGLTERVMDRIVINARN